MKDRLVFVPLGGVGEIGMNVYLYGLDDEWLMVDLGITFPDERLPGVEIVLPDLRFAESLGRKLKGLVLTHAHEDHIGAVPYLWRKLDVPVWCSAFTGTVLRHKLVETGLDREVPINKVEPGTEFAVGPFHCRFLHMTHSVPEAQALVLDTRHGRVLHTGDWKLDPAPQIGPRSDTKGLEALGKSGVLAMVGDSTNALSPGTSGSEAEVRDSLVKLIGEQPHRVVVTSFSSNVARLETAMVAAREAGREVFVVGRSMRRMLEAARECGYLKEAPPVRDERDADTLPRNRILYLCTGSQGEARSALTRVAAGQHPRVRLEAGDTVIFSSKIIPGNERVLYNLHNQLVRNHVEVITEVDHFVHVSGHPCRDEMEQMYKWIRPQIAVPVHGEARHLQAHERLARKMGVAEVPMIENGQMLGLAPGPVAVIGEVRHGRMVQESDGLVEATDELFKTRRRLMSHGTILVGLVLDEAGSVLAEPQMTALGALEIEQFEDRRKEIVDEIVDGLEGLSDVHARDDERVREATRAAVRQTLDLPRHRRPIVEVQVTRIGSETMAALEDEPVGASG